VGVALAFFLLMARQMMMLSTPIGQPLLSLFNLYLNFSSTKCQGEPFGIATKIKQIKLDI